MALVVYSLRLETALLRDLFAVTPIVMQYTEEVAKAGHEHVFHQDDLLQTPQESDDEGGDARSDKKTHHQTLKLLRQLEKDILKTLLNVSAPG